MKHNSDIDFILYWVDSNDVNWQNKKSKYTIKKTEDGSVSRYRDWDNLKYWFRGVAKFAPWVRKVYLVTDNQKPEWLNLQNDALVLVDHKDFIDKKYLPLFNSSAIEIGIHKICGLSGKFVLFNDDMFIINNIKADYYFKKDLPIDIAGLTRAVSAPSENTNAFNWLMNNDYNLINKKFNKNEVLKRNWKQWFKLSYGKTLIRTLLNCNRDKFDGIVNPHLSAPYLKQDFENVWNEFPEELNNVYNNRFRSKNDINQYVFRFYRMCEGNFYPRAIKGKYIGVKNKKDVLKTAKMIEKQSVPEICINDCWEEEDYLYAKDRINQAFDKILSEKCEYEI